MSADENYPAQDSNTTSPRPIEILQVEDDEGDARLLDITLKKSKVANTIHTVKDGVEALMFLRGEGQYATSPRPHLVLLDLSLPRKDGHEVLSEIKADDNLKDIPVVVLTSSNNDKDLLSAYDLKADGYINKPIDFKQFIWIVGQIERFWISVVDLPQR